MSTLRQFNTPISLNSAALSATHNSNTLGSLFTTGGNVGIGTTSPISNLHVNGTIALNVMPTFNSSGTIRLGRIDDPNLRFHEIVVNNSTSADANLMRFFLHDATTSSSTSEILTLRGNGNVGIGTSSPNEKLTINTLGNISLTSNAFDTGKIIFGSVVSGAYNTGSRYYIQRGGTSGNMNHLVIHTPNEAPNSGVNFMTTNQVSRMFINSSSGNVGIGTTSPNYVLDVVGTVDATNMISSNLLLTGKSDGSTLIYFDTERQWRFFQYGAGTGAFLGLQSLVANKSFDIVHTDGGSFARFFARNNAGDSYVSIGNLRTLNITAETLLNTNSVLTNVSAGILNIGNGNPANSVTTANIAFSFVDGGYNHYITSRHNNATSSNQNALDFWLNNSTSANASSSPDVGNVIGMSVTATGVGIGTTAPNSALHVAGLISAAPIGNGIHMGIDSSNVSVIQLNSGTSGQSMIDFGYSSNSYQSKIIHYNTTKSLGFRVAASSTDALTIASSGNIGIGTTSPVEKLDVSGNLCLGNSTQSNYIVFFGTNSDAGSNHTYIGERIFNPPEQSELLLFKGNDVTTGGGPDRIRLLAAEHRFDTFTTSSILAGTFENIATHGSTRMIITTAGNVGIGTIDPLYSLQVDGNVALNVMPGIGSVGSIKIGRQDFNARWHMINCNTGTAASLNTMIFNLHDAVTSTSNTPVLALRGDGRVGINVTAPAYALDVNGTIDASIYTGGSIAVTGITTGTLRLTSMTATNILISGNVDAGGQFLGQSNDSVTSASFSWTGDTNTGIYRPLADTIGFVTNGVDRFRLASNGNLLMAGAANNNYGINMPTGGYGIHWQTGTGGVSRIYDDSDLRICTDDNMRFYTGSSISTPGTERMTLTSTGVGIGYNNPGAPLTVGTSTTINVAGGYFFANSTPNLNPWSTSNQPISIFATSAILCQTNFLASSDIRIKNICDETINLNHIDNINPEIYTYKDSIRNPRKNIGFIAQNVFEHCPEAVSIHQGIIPDIMKVVDILEKNETLITVKNDYNLKEKDIIKIMIDDNDLSGQDVEVIYADEDIIQCKVSYSERLKETIFIYGRQVEDFHELNYDYIFALGFAGIKESRKDIILLKEQLQAEKTLTQQQETTIQNLETRVVSLEARLTAAGL